MKPVIPITALQDGEMMACKVDDVDVLLCRVDGQFYATANRCSHARQALDGGRLRGFEVICPLHSARFDIRDGSCKAAPATQPIQTFPVMIEAGKVMVSVEGAKQPPRPRFGPLN